MQKATGLFFVLLLTLWGLCGSAWALTAEDITAQTAVLIDADTGQVLFEKNKDQKMYPASITKIMTGLLAAELCDPNEMMEVTQAALEVPRNTSHIALDVGEQVSVNDMLYALLLYSANDAANTLAVHMAGTQEDFAFLMNRRARTVGAFNTNFTNAHGLPDDNHYTTAYDMALITMEASRNETFMKYFGTPRYTMAPTNKQSEERYFHNGHYMLLPDGWCYNPDVIGGKVGYTEEARHTISTVATKDGRTLVAVVMSTGIDEKFDDTQALFDYGFGELEEHTIPRARLLPTGGIPLEENGVVTGLVNLLLDEDITILLPIGTDPSRIQIEPQYPTIYNSRSAMAETTPKVTLTLAGATEDDSPMQLLQLALTPELTLLDLQDEIEEEGSSFSIGRLFAIVGKVLAVVAILILLLAVVMIALRVRNRRRVLRQREMRRQNYLRRMEEKQRRGPNNRNGW